MLRCVCLVKITSFSTSYTLYTWTNSCVETLPDSEGAIPHLFCYFCDICLGILGDALSLICPSIESAAADPVSPIHPTYLTIFFSHRVSYSCGRLLFALCLNSGSGAVACFSESPKPIMKTGRGKRSVCLYIKYFSVPFFLFWN